MYFVFLMITIFIMLFLYDTTMRNNNRTQIQYDNAIDHAVEDGVAHMVEYDSTDTVILNRDAAVNNFFQSAYAALGISDSPSAKVWLDIYTPVILMTDTDGFYVRHCYEVPAADGGIQTLSGWSEKYTYAKSSISNKYILSFTISDVVQILDTASGSVMEGDYHDLLQMMPDLVQEFPCMATDEEFLTAKHTCISDSITGRMEYYINEHNRIANDYGIKYQFFLPHITDYDWERAIDGISMLVVFQGYPYPSGRGYFNMVTVGGARLAKQPKYYITSEKNGRMIYHDFSCPQVTAAAKEKSYDNTRECAELGAYPCNLCNP